MRIVKLTSLGMRQTYSPEMLSPQHNYITPNSKAIHKNSHAVAYCLMAYRCLWLKAHFAPEFWASVMSGCHPDKLPRYLGVARAEGWEPTEITNLGKFKSTEPLTIGTLNINNLSNKFSALRNTIMQGLIGVKGIGEKAAEIFTGAGNFNSIDEFVQNPERRIKTAIERFIKLGAFSHLHKNSRALYYYYLFNYSDTSKDAKELKEEVNKKLFEAQGWNEKTIKEEKERQIAQYQQIYPKRKVLPAGIKNWKPKINYSLEWFEKAYPKDFTIDERLEFQKDYLGYCVESPLSKFIISGDNTITNAIAYCTEEGKNSSFNIECVIISAVLMRSKNDNPYLKMVVTDGIQNATLFMWQREMALQVPTMLVANQGVRIPVSYEVDKKTFSVSRRGIIDRLKEKPDENP